MKKYVVRMSAGLANRMLQYAYALYLEKRGNDVYVDNNYKPTEWKMEEIDWERIFPHAPLRQAPKSLIFRYGGCYTWLDKIRRHYLPFTSKVWMQTNTAKVPTEAELEKHAYFIGVYQDARIADFVKEEALKSFRFAPFETGSQNALLEEKMKSENSVAIHFRKGEDYMKKQGFHNTCTIEYYEEAIKLIKSKVENPVFYVFTDNPKWVKEHLKGIEYTLVEGNPPIGWGNHFDMQLMSCCKHNIIANSTYSWWGAFLNPNPNKIVIDPKYWFNPELPRYKNMENNTVCKGWIVL
jgi:hypothetical protein